MRLRARSDVGPGRKAAGLLGGMLVMVVTFLGHDAASSSHAGGDSAWTTYQALSLLEERDLTLSEWQDVLDRFPIHWVRNDDGEPVFTFPWGTAVVISPVIAVMAAGEAITGGSLEDNLRNQFAPHEVENTVASVLVAVTAGVLFVIARSELGSVPVGVVVALGFAFATSAFSTASRALWSHGPAMLILAVELLLLTRARRGQDRLLVLLGPLFVLAYAIRPPTAMVAGALTGVVAIAHRRRLPAVVAGGATAGAVYVAINLATYQRLQPPYYSPGRLTGSGTFFEGLAGNLVSPQRGLLIWCPAVLVAAAAGVVVARRRGTVDTLTVGLVLGVALTWIVVSTLDPWWAGFSVGPRLFTDVLPLLVVLALPAVHALRHSGWAARGAFAVLLAFSLFTNVRGATRFETQLWNAEPVDVHDDPDRIWDWGDLQFLR